MGRPVRVRAGPRYAALVASLEPTTLQFGGGAESRRVGQAAYFCLVSVTYVSYKRRHRRLLNQGARQMADGDVRDSVIVKPQAGHIGAEIQGVDLKRPLSDGEV